MQTICEEINTLNAFAARLGPVGDAYKKYHKANGDFKDGVNILDVLKTIGEECEKDQAIINRCYSMIDAYLRARKVRT